MGRDYNAMNYIVKLLKKTPELAYSQNMAAEDFPAWQKKVKDKAKELMGLEGNVYEKPVVNLLFSKQRDGYRIDKYEISSEENLWNTMLVLVPDTATEKNPAPVVLCTPGTRWTKEQLSGEEFEDLDYAPAQGTVTGHYFYANTMALRYCRAGIVAIATDDFFCGETKNNTDCFDDWSWVCTVLQAMGRSMLSITVGMHLAQLAFAKTLPYVDEKRVAVSGHSLGTESCMLMGVLDDSIGAMVFNDFLSDTKERVLAVSPQENYADYIIPYKDYFGVYRYFTYPDLLCAFAPRKLLITEGGGTNHLKKVEAAYASAGKREAFTYHYYREYADPKDRRFDDEPMPRGISQQEYFLRSNCVPEHHYFKFELAVPWLKAQFEMPE